MTNAQILKDRIKKQCEIQGKSSTLMLSELSLGVNAINQINEKKGMGSFALAKIADYLDCSVDYLLGRTDEPNGYNNISNIDTTVNGTQANIINNDRNNDNFDEVKNILNHLSTATKFRAIADILDLLEEKYIKSEIEAEPKINITYSKIYADEGGVTKKETPAGLPKISEFFDD